MIQNLKKTKRANPISNNSKKIFYTVDLHFLRELREAKLYRDEFMTKKARLSFVNETEIMNSVDATVVLSEKEKNILNLSFKF